MRFVDADAEISPMYWIVVERTPIVECNISMAIFTAFAFYYIIDIKFPPKVQDLLLFVQEKIFGRSAKDTSLPDLHFLETLWLRDTR